MQVPYWQPGTQYDYDAVVQFEGHRYKIVEPHRSQSDWTPPETPALWGRLSDDDGQQQPQFKQQQQQQQPLAQPTPQYQDDKQSEPAPEPHKHWYEEDSNKKKLEIGAGLAAGAALLAGGLFAYKKHEQHVEERKAGEWSRNKWIEEAHARTEALRRQGPQGLAVWALTHGKSIPKDAIVTGEEHGRSLYSSRAFYEGALVIGKASETFHKGGLIGYADEEIEVDEYEVLVGDLSRLKWVSTGGRLNVGSLGYNPVQGGHEKDGTPVYVAQAPYKDSTHPAKVSEQLDGAYITFGGKEHVVKEYRVLCYN